VRLNTFHAKAAKANPQRRKIFRLKVTLCETLCLGDFVALL
jgi:hypothetical protein